MPGSSTSSYNKRGETTQYASETPTGLKPYQDQFAKGYGDIYSQYQNIMNQPLNLKSAPIFSATLDPIVQNTISKGVQGIKSQQATQGAQTAQALNVAGSGNNSALLNVLNRQSAISGAAGANQLYAIGQEQQRALDLARQQAIAQQNADIIAARNSKIAGLTPGLGLLQTLIQMGQVSRGSEKRGHTITTESGSGEESRGFFG